MGSVNNKRVHDMARPTKHRLEPAKIPHDLNAEFMAAKEKTGDTHTNAVEEAVRLYVKAAKKRAKAAPA